MRPSASEKSGSTFHYYSFEAQLKPIHIVYKRNIRLKGRKKKADWLGTPGPKEQRASEFPGFPLYLMYPRLSAEEAGNTEMKMGR